MADNDHEETGTDTNSNGKNDVFCAVRTEIVEDSWIGWRQGTIDWWAVSQMKPSFSYCNLLL
jgi:hypothetical protein